MATPSSRPAWFDEFLADRGTRKPSPHTLAAYCRDFDGIAAIITGQPDVSELALEDLNRDALGTAFSVFAVTHAAASIRRAWSTWNTLCEFLYSSELIPANPMATVARPKTDKTLAKALPPNAINALLTAMDADAGEEERRDAWAIRDRAVILTALLTGLRLAELVGLNIGDIRTVDSGAVLHVRSKGGKDRRVPIEAPLLGVLDEYLASRTLRFGAPRGHSPGGGLAGWPSAAPLFVDARDGSRITHRTLQYRVLRAFRRAGIDAERQRGALVHGRTCHSICVSPGWSIIGPPLGRIEGVFCDQDHTVGCWGEVSRAARQPSSFARRARRRLELPGRDRVNVSLRFSHQSNRW